MKLLVLRENLKNAVSAVIGATGTSALPVLKNVLIRAEKSGARLLATNLELAITVTFPAKIVAQGSVTVPVQTLSTMLQSTTQEKIHLEKKGEKVLLYTDNYTAHLQTIPETEFPIIPTPGDGKRAIIFEGDVLRNAFDQVVCAAAAQSEFRPELAGVQLRYEGAEVKIAATDSFRLAEKTISDAAYAATIEKPFSVIIPAKNILEIIKVLPPGQVRFYVDAAQAVFQAETIEIVTRLIEGSFPDYQQIVPKSFDARVWVSGSELLEGLRLSQVFTGKLRAVTCSLYENKKTLGLFSQEAGFGENNYLVPAKIEGDVFDAVFNVGYFVDGVRAVLKHNKDDALFIGLNKEKKPALIKSVSDPSYTYIVMPIKQ